jgi:hypothetical protein
MRWNTTYSAIRRFKVEAEIYEQNGGKSSMCQSSNQTKMLVRLKELVKAASHRSWEPGMYLPRKESAGDQVGARLQGYMVRWSTNHRGWQGSERSTLR